MPARMWSARWPTLQNFDEVSYEVSAVRKQMTDNRYCVWGYDFDLIVLVLVLDAVELFLNLDEENESGKQVSD